MASNGDQVLQAGAIRLRRVTADEYVEVALPWYQDPEVLRFSEGGEPPYDRPRMRRMYDALTAQGELYLVELGEPGEPEPQPDGDGWRAVGDAALLRDDLPIVIGRREDRGRGLGSQVLQLLVQRARALGWRELHVGPIDPANHRSRRMFQRAGFIETDAAQRAEAPRITMRLALRT